MGIVILVYGYYAFIPISIAATLIYNHKYERYKREQGYKNNYKGSYMFKGFYDGRRLKTVLDYFIKFFVPGFQLEPIIDLLLLKSSAKVDFNREKLSKEIEWVDPNIVDGEFKIISEEILITDEEKKELGKEDIIPPINLNDDEPAREYARAIDEYIKLYGKNNDEFNSYESGNDYIWEKNSGPHLK